jgi:dUTPase
VQFTPDRPVLGLERKRARQKTAGRFHRFRAIVEVREVDPVPVRCIQVSSSTGTFLATRSYIPTHNSSLGRLGLLIHSTAGFIDPGWDGHVTLELSNVANLPITIYPHMKIGQLSFVQLSEPAERPYGSGGLGSKYQGQQGPTPSAYWRNFTD